MTGEPHPLNDNFPDEEKQRVLELMESLTPMERKLMVLLSQGLTSKETGKLLNRSYRTIEAHRARIILKFGARSMAHVFAIVSEIEHKQEPPMPDKDHVK